MSEDVAHGFMVLPALPHQGSLGQQCDQRPEHHLRTENCSGCIVISSLIYAVYDSGNKPHNSKIPQQLSNSQTSSCHAWQLKNN